MFRRKDIPKADRSPEMEVKCGWGKQWDPPEVPKCVDPRDCPKPPARNDRIWGSYEDDGPSTEIGSVYWYECREGKAIKTN